VFSLSRNQCCECGFIPDPGPRVPKTTTKEKGEKILVVLPFFVATNITKLKIILFLTGLEKMWVNLQRTINFLSKTLSFPFSKYRFGIRDPGSEIRDPRSGIRKKPPPDPGSGVKKAPDPGSGTLLAT
jgi:hypothetical protein